MQTVKLAVVTGAAIVLSACGGPGHDPRGLAPGEVLVQTSTTGKASAKPDEARFSVGVTTVAVTSAEASAVNNRKMTAVVEALKAQGVAEADIQTSQVTVQRQDWGANKGKFEANNTVSARLREIAKAGAAVAAATAAGANILSGPDLRTADPEAASRSAYAAAFKSARARADAYAEAAGLKVVRVLRIRDDPRPEAGPPMTYGLADSVAMQTASAPPIMAGTNETSVTVAVDFALAPK